MDLGIHYASFSHPDWDRRLVERLAATARIADDGGIALFTVMDHYFQMEMSGGPAEPMLEGYTTLGFVAGRTERIALGLFVTGVTYRHPGLLAKIVTTLDVLSGGRAWLGIGAAWYEREHDGLGVPYPPVAERFERLEETLRICRQMWSDDDGPFHGRHYRLAETICVPAPVNATVPIVIGGSGERKTLRLVAQYGDACNLFTGEGPAGVAAKLDVLRRHCDDVGRDYDRIRKTILWFGDPVAEPERFAREMEAYAALGVSLTSLMPPTEDPERWAAALVEQAVPRAAALG
ncbi:MULTISPECIES: LLM class F420-dependent oxidoreductase [unclassified Nocardioides]|uniref:LLM class F420-dependent oxidoreductase n=1 Tax=unclassified Nocardioides TaxID=2615069 RepID=UPI0011539008|nr:MULTISPECIES: LLM class F420-dependent oxidoreductase [unclassified Nocardioides]TQK71192.1 F420-dependent oxidoreductase-like protein [Nocardioides sp. SLBN-35]WGY04639.1 LLM class F420-dependent oxidoreductase [Nocardioides sp. QY071]